MIKVFIHLTKLALIAFLTVLCVSCTHSVNFGNSVKGNGKLTTQSRTVEGAFKAIDANTGIEVMVEQSDDREITVETDENIQNLIEIKVENEVLVIRSKEGYNTEFTPKVTVKTPVINGLFASSGSTIKTSKTLVTDVLDVKSSSGSTIVISVEADDLSLESSSGSNLNASGKALKLESSSSSGSSIDAKGLLANNVVAKASSGSSIDVSPVLSLDASASSGGDIDYHQAPKTITKSESSGGSVSGS